MRRGARGKPRVEYDRGWGWIARKANGDEVVPGFVWASRSVARTVAIEADWADDLAASKEPRP